MTQRIEVDIPDKSLGTLSVITLKFENQAKTARYLLANRTLSFKADFTISFVAKELGMIGANLNKFSSSAFPCQQVVVTSRD